MNKLHKLKIEDCKAKPEPTKEVLDQIAADAKREPERYLRETIVPEGGE